MTPNETLRDITSAVLPTGILLIVLVCVELSDLFCYFITHCFYLFCVFWLKNDVLIQR